MQFSIQNKNALIANELGLQSTTISFSMDHQNECNSHHFFRMHLRRSYCFGSVWHAWCMHFRRKSKNHYANLNQFVILWQYLILRCESNTLWAIHVQEFSYVMGSNLRSHPISKNRFWRTSMIYLKKRPTTEENKTWFKLNAFFFQFPFQILRLVKRLKRNDNIRLPNKKRNAFLK